MKRRCAIKKVCWSAGLRGPFSCIAPTPLLLPDDYLVPAPGPGVCRICCGPTAASFAHCFACRSLTRRLRLPLAPVLPVRLCPLPGPLYAVLMGYKESPLLEQRQRYGDTVVALLAAFTYHHASCLRRVLGGPVDVVLPVPSSSRPGRPPLDRVPGLPERVARDLAPAIWLPAALARAGDTIGHMRPNARAFEVPPWARPAVAGGRIVLLDDTYVSGSRAQSAAAACRLAGACSVLIVPLGRVIRPDRSVLNAGFLRRQFVVADHVSPAAPGSAPCCRCAQTGASIE